MAVKKSAAKSVVGSQVAAVETAVVVEKVSKLSAENVIKDMGKLQLEAQNALAELSGKIVTGVNTLNDVNVAIGHAKLRLQELYNIESEAVNLDEVRQEIEDARSAWNDELERLNDLKQKQEAEYSYKLTIKRRDDEDKVAANHKIREEALKLKELEAKNREVEFVELRKQVEGFPALTKKEVDREVVIVTNTLKRNYEHEKALASKDSENAAREHLFGIQALKTQVEQLLSHQSTLYEQLETATNNAKEIANAALQSRSGQDSLQAVQKVLETTGNQANNRK